MGWNLASKRIFMSSVEKSENYSLLGAISQNQLIAFMVTKGSTLSEIYSYFISKLIEHFKYKGIMDKTVFLSDGSKVHKSKFMNEIYKNSYKFITLPCYSPELNPIELCWSKWKREVKRGGSISGEDD